VGSDDRCDEESRASADRRVPIAIAGNPTASASDPRAREGSKQTPRNTTDGNPALASGATEDRPEESAEAAYKSGNKKERN